MVNYEPVERSLEVLGALFFAHLAWNFVNLIKPKPKPKSVPEESPLEKLYPVIEAEIRTVRDNADDIAQGLKLLSDGRSEVDQPMAILDIDLPSINRQLLKLIRDQSRSIAEKFKILSELHVMELNVLHTETLLKKDAQFGGQGMEEVMQAEMRHLKEAKQRYIESIQELGANPVQKIREEFAGIELNFRQKFAVIFDRITTESDLTTQVLGLEAKQRNLLAELEIDFACKSGEELIPLLWQQEDILNDVHPIIILWKISGLKNMLRDLVGQETDIKSQGFYTIFPGLRIKPTIKRGPEAKRIDIQLEFCDVQHEDGDVPPLPFLHYRKYVLLDQSTDSPKENLELIDRPGFGMRNVLNVMLPTFSKAQICSMDDLNDEGRYVKNDQLLVKIILEPMTLVSRSIASDNGLVWKIVNYSKKKQDAKAGRKRWLISEPFLTGPMGYYVQAQAALDGVKNGQGVFISTEVKFILGEYDGTLARPLKGKCTFQLMDQSNASKKEDISMVREFDFDTSGDPSMAQTSEVKAWLLPKFVPQIKAERAPYLIDDSIVIKVNVDV